MGLANDLYNRSYKLSPGICFIIRDPKQREVFAANFRDRVVHHLYYHYTHKLFERTFIADSYSCIEGRGTHYGISRLAHHIRGESDNYSKPCYVLKVDVKGYFMHINREKLLSICMDTLEKMKNRRISNGKPWITEVDYGLVCYLTKIFVLQNPLDNCRKRGNLSDWKGLPPSKSLFCSPQGCGLPIGNLTSQLFSNVYMNRFDQFCKRELHCRRYGRYVDDAYVVSTNKELLHSLIPLMREFLKEELHLQMHPDKISINNCMMGVPFLGAFLKPWRVYLMNSTARRIRRNIRTLSPETTPPFYICSSMSSYAGVFSHYQSKFVCEKSLCATNPRLQQRGFFVKNMRRFYVYRSVVREWYRYLQYL